MPSKHELGHILWSVVFIIMAMNFGANIFLHLGNPQIFIGWWTLLLIVPCALNVVRNGVKLVPAFGIAVGIFILLRLQSLVRFGRIGDLLVPPLFISAAIFSFTFRKESHRKMHNDGRNCNCGICDDETEQHIHLRDMVLKNCKRAMEYQRDIKVYFGSRTITYDGELFEGATIKAVFGKCTLDLRNAVLVGDIEITNMVICGKVEVLLPESVKAEVVGIPIIGEIDNKADAPLGDINANLSIPSVCILSEMCVV